MSNICDFNILKGNDLKEASIICYDNAHLKRSDKKDLVIVKGYPEQSGLLNKAVLISQWKYNKKGVPYMAAFKMLETQLGVTRSIQRSATPRFIYGEKHIINLSKLLGIDIG